MHHCIVVRPGCRIMESLISKYTHQMHIGRAHGSGSFEAHQSRALHTAGVAYTAA